MPLIDQVELVTLMGMRIGEKGHALDPTACARIAWLRRVIDMRGHGRRVKIAADGGIREWTVPALRDAGADTVVMGSLAFGSANLAETIAWLRELPGPSSG